MICPKDKKQTKTNYDIYEMIENLNISEHLIILRNIYIYICCVNGNDIMTGSIIFSSNNTEVGSVDGLGLAVC